MPKAPPGWFPTVAPPGGRRVDRIVEGMKRDGVPLTRENYLQMAHGSDWQGEWGAELEADPPEEIQNWETWRGKGN